MNQALAQNGIPQATPVADQLDGGTYEVVRQRLAEQGRVLLERVNRLDAQRRQLFGGNETVVLATAKVRTEHACVARNLVAVGDRLLLGCHVRMGLKSEVAIGDVFTELALDGESITPAPLRVLAGEAFAEDFRELHQYYKDARLLQLRRTDRHVLAAFQTGQRLDDVRVLRWLIRGVGRDETLEYVDNRGEQDYSFPPSHDVAWTRVTRDQHVHGAYPHVNILDTIFVECMGGDLTIKIENNTATGAGIFADPVKDPSQGLDDAEFHYAALENLILLKVRPYRESAYRHVVFNKLTAEAVRIDAIASSCQQLPEGHGIIFPGGYYLASGSHKIFPHDAGEREFVRLHRSPNGEDLAYVYYKRDIGTYVVLRYNLITRQVDPPMIVHGYCLLEDGRMVVLRAEDEPARLHTLQIWRTPFSIDSFAAAAPVGDSFLAKLGNRELVRGVSDILHLQRLIDFQKPTSAAYLDLLKNLGRVRDSYHWIGHPDACGLAEQLKAIDASTSGVIDEFQKAAQLAEQANQRVAALEAGAETLLKSIALGAKDTLDAFVKPLSELRRQRGAVAAGRTIRRVDAARLDALDQRLAKTGETLSASAVQFLARDAALEPYHRELAGLAGQAEALATTAAAAQLDRRFDELAQSLDLLIEIVNTLAIANDVARTAIVERVGAVYALLNRARAIASARRREIGGVEGRAAFAAQGALFAQSMANALALCDSPEKCDEALARLTLALEELEARFAEHDDFQEQLAAKREELSEGFDARKQYLLDERNRRANNLARAADRLIPGVAKRAANAAAVEDIEALFASDQMVLKVRAVIAELRALGDTVKADDRESRLKAAREHAVRQVRDRSELFEGETIRLGRHRFSVNRQALELTLLPRPRADGEDELAFHLTGTDYFSSATDASLTPYRRMWDQPLVSESPEVYRGEHLAWRILDAAEHARDGLDPATLREALLDRGRLDELVRAFAAKRPDEGYDRGVHDNDAALIIGGVAHLREACGLLRVPPAARALALLAWDRLEADELRESWRRQCRSLAQAREEFPTNDGLATALMPLAKEMVDAVGAFAQRYRLPHDQHLLRAAGDYLFQELSEEGPPAFVRSGEADALERRFDEHLHTGKAVLGLRADLAELAGQLDAAWRLAVAWLEAFCARRAPELAHVVPEVAAGMLASDQPRRPVSARTSLTIEGVLGQHPRIREKRLDVRLDEFEERLTRFTADRVPDYRAYQAARRAAIDGERAALRLDELQSRVLTSFVRNRLIDEVYLPLLGDNFAKQLGAAGDAKRTDSMGLLLLISPPGYGKTTLIEYVASTLGLTFVKINGPAIGARVESLDPAEAPNATARLELEKLNLALEMGNNVLLVLDDIQHVSPALLQKFISLCDGQRRIEGVWRGRGRTHDLRGKKFAMVMAGNPYTESGEMFKIPDMLANRADIHNLGDILGGHRESFEQSYIENCLGVNAVLQPIVGHSRRDFSCLLRLAAGDEAARGELEHPFAAAEITEIVAVLKHLIRIRAVLVQVNGQYIASAGMSDDYRSEPPFKLQGSYRNMAKLAEKVVPVMNADEVERLILDHYAAESQTLTTAAESNLLKLKELVGALGPADAARWAEIKRTYARRQEIIGSEDDPAAIAALQLVKLNELVGALGASLAGDGRAKPLAEELAPVLERLSTALAQRPAADAQPKIEIFNTLPKYYASLYQHHIQVIEHSLVPAIESLTQSSASNQRVREQLQEVVRALRGMISKQSTSQVLDLGEEERGTGR